MAQVTDDLLGKDTDPPGVGAIDGRPGDAARETPPARPAADAADPLHGRAAAATSLPRAAPATITPTPLGDETEAVEPPPASPGWRERRRNRVSKWDRPPDPRDWRYFVGTLGKILIATGMLLFGFVAYQLWGTGIETARAQNALEDTFEATVAANQAVADEPTGADLDTDEPAAAGDGATTATPNDDAGAAADPTDDPADGDSPDGQSGEVETEADAGDRTPSDVVPGGVDLSAEAVVQNVPIVPPGEAIAKIEIPRIGIENLFVVQGVKLDDLKKGPGHYPDTPLPGQLGNASIAGHRTTYGAPFFDVDQLQPGDEIIVTMVTGDQFVYGVTGSQVVTAADSWVIGTRDENVAELTLTTCHPKYTARDRLVVHSVLVPERSAQVGQAEFWDAGTRDVVVDGGDTGETAEADRPTGDDPTFDTETDESGASEATAQDGDGVGVGDEVEAGTGSETDDEPSDRTDAVFLDPTPDADEDTGEAADSATSSATADAGAAGDTDASEAEAAGENAENPVAVVDPDDAEIDAFSEGWFDDREAWPQIALWGSVLTIISLLAYQLSKKTRHDSIGFMVGIFPFLFALYFFFQNVNRLLPPGL